MHQTAFAFEKGLRHSFDPNVKFVVPGWDIEERERVVCIGNRVKRCRECNYNSAHLWMNITKNVRDAFARKRHRFGRASLVETKIESLPFIMREDIMKEGIGIWKLNGGARGNDLKVWNKCSVLLKQRVFPLGWKRKRRGPGSWFQPYYCRHSTSLSLVRGDN